MPDVLIGDSSAEMESASDKKLHTLNFADPLLGLSEHAWECKALRSMGSSPSQPSAAATTTGPSNECSDFLLLI
jgi:hypothetical protein